MVFSNSIIPTAISVFSTLCWYAVYKKFRTAFKWEEEFTSRVVAAIHAIIVVILAFFSIKYGPNPLYNPGKKIYITVISNLLNKIENKIYEYSFIRNSEYKNTKFYNSSFILNNKTSTLFQFISKATHIFVFSLL